MPSTVFLVGASCRALAWSAYEAGLQVVACDLFADEDLKEVAQAVRADSLRRRDVARAISPQLKASLNDGMWVLPAGGTENQSTLWRWLQRTAQFIGPSHASLLSVRRPQELAATVSGGEIEVPQLITDGQPRPTHGRWLLKSRLSAGGIQVSRWTSESQAGETLCLGSKLDYLQREIQGKDFAATFIATRNSLELVGVTRQWTGDERLGAQGWWYCASQGPIPMELRQQEAILQLGQTLHAAFGLEGIFGVDLRFDGERFWLLEVNPRYPAGAEVLERASRQSLVARYLELKEEDETLGPSSATEVTAWSDSRYHDIWAKGIWFNRSEESRTVSASGIQRAMATDCRWDRPADVGIG